MPAINQERLDRIFFLGRRRVFNVPLHIEMCYRSSVSDLVV